MVQLLNIHKTYPIKNGTPLAALNNISLNILPNEWVAIMGPSGSGKSTLLNILGCLDPVSSGTYQFKNKCLSARSENQKAQFRNQELGFIFQHFNLIPHYSAIQNIALPLIYQGLSHSSALKKASKALHNVHLTKRKHHTPNQLSGGEKQRVAIARALVTEPSIILADEPTGNLDSVTTQHIMNLLAHIHAQGKTIIMVTHDTQLAKQTQRIITLADGQLISDSKT